MIEWLECKVQGEAVLPQEAGEIGKNQIIANFLRTDPSFCSFVEPEFSFQYFS